MSDEPLVPRAVAAYAFRVFQARALRLPVPQYREALVELLGLLEDCHQAEKEAEPREGAAAP